MYFGEIIQEIQEYYEKILCVFLHSICERLDI